MGFNRFRPTRYSVEQINRFGQCPGCGREIQMNRFILSKGRNARTIVMCDDCIKSYVKEYRSSRPVPKAFHELKTSKKCRRITAAVLLLAIFIGLFADAFHKEYMELNSRYEDFTYHYGYQLDLSNPESYRFNYYQLTSDQKEIYREFLANAYKSTNDITGSYSDEDLKIAINAYYSDYPEYFWYKSVWSYTDDGDYTYSEIATWDVSSNEIDEFRSRVDEIVSEASAYSTDFAKIQFVYEWLTDNVYYDYGMLDQTDTRSGDEYSKEEWQTWSAYGAIVNKRAVCQGISRAFELIMHCLGYECGYITGNVTGGRHSWNILLLDGNEYYFDATWDCRKEKSNCKTFDYFFITKAEMDREHVAEIEYDTGCKSKFYNEYDYFSHYNCYLEEYSFDAAQKIIDSQYENNYVYMKFASEEEFESAISDISRLGDYYREKTGIDESYYYHNGTMYTIVIHKEYTT